jgi:HEAT repeat protein
MTIDVLAQGLSDADAERRRRTVVQLKQIAVPQAEEARDKLASLFVRALGDADWRVRKEAVEAAHQRALDVGLVRPLIIALSQGENIGLRNAALDVLAQLGAAVVSELVSALPEVPEHARKFVVEALGDSNSALAIPELVRAARGSDVNVASEAIEALSQIDGAEAEAAIREQLRSPSGLLRVAALEALNRREAVLPWEELAPLLGDNLLRRVALSALGRTGRMEALGPLFSALSEPARGVVARAAVSIIALLNHSAPARQRAREHLAALTPAARHTLRALLDEDAELEVRRAAVELLLRARDESALPAAIAHLGDDAPSPAMVEALRAWGGPAVEPLLRLSSGHPSPRGRATALELAADLALLGEPAGFPSAVRARLIAALDESEPAVVEAACRCLGEGGGAEDARELSAHFAGASPERGKQLSRALSRLAERFPREVEQALPAADAPDVCGVALATVLGSMGIAALPRLQVLLAADDADVRRAAVQALGRVGGERARSLVPIALADESAEVQVMAAQVLGGLRGPAGERGAVDDLLQALKSPLPQVQAAAARALGQTGSSLALQPLHELLASPRVGLAVAAVEALGALRPSSLLDDLLPALGHGDAEVVKAALQVVSRLDTPRSALALARALDHTAWDVRALAASLLGATGDPRYADGLRQRMLRERDSLVAEAIADALLQLGEEG